MTNRPFFFEYFAEDPWLTGLMAAEAVNGIQGVGVVAALKHYAANNFEHNRHWQDAIVDRAGLREAEMLGLQIAIERSQPGPTMPILGEKWGTPVTIRFDEGAEIGYRWYASAGRTPMYRFGHGLSYTSFEYGNFQVSGGETVRATFTVTNTGKRSGADVPQVYLTNVGQTKRMRLLGFERVELQPGESKQVTVTADPRLLARFDDQAQQWRIDGESYEVALARSAGAPVLTAETQLGSRLFGK